MPPDPDIQRLPPGGPANGRRPALCNAAASSCRGAISRLPGSRREVVLIRADHERLASITTGSCVCIRCALSTCASPSLTRDRSAPTAVPNATATIPITDKLLTDRMFNRSTARIRRCRLNNGRILGAHQTARNSTDGVYRNREKSSKVSVRSHAECENKTKAFSVRFSLCAFSLAKELALKGVCSIRRSA
jgi:hypothetical protein